MKRNVIVVGMPRSGTSLTASVFARQGYYAAEPGAGELRHGDEFNPDGYFEAESLVEANARVLGRAGYPYHNTWLYEPIPDELAGAIGDLDHTPQDQRLVDAYQARRPWIWKDPRLCYTLSYWWPLMDPDATTVLITRRNKADIWNSFVRLGWRTDTRHEREDVYARIDAHLGAAMTAVRKHAIPYIEIDYDEYRRNPEETARRVSRTFGLEIEADELGFRSAYDHSGIRGSAEQFLERLTGALPTSIRRTAKKIVPAGVVRALFPSRRE